MAIAFRAVSTAGDGSGTTLVVTKPAGVVDNDVMVLVFYAESSGASGAFSVTGTWTLVHSITQIGSAPDFEAWVWVRKAASEGADYTVSWDGDAIWRTAAITSYSGVDTTTQQDATATEAAGAASDTTAIATGLTTVTANALLVYLLAEFTGTTAGTYTSPIVDERTDFGGLAIADGAQVSAGASGNKQSTLAAGAWWTTFLMALRPTVAATKAPPPQVPSLAYILGR